MLEGFDPRRDPELAAELPEAMATCPPQCRIVVTTDTELGSVLAEVRLAGRLVELDQGDLELDPAEALDLLEQHATWDDGSEATAVVDLCAGWVGALLVAARRRTRYPDDDVAAWLRTRGCEVLLGSWLDACDDATREVLVATAFLDVLHPDLVDAVLPGSQAGVALLTLAREPGPVRPAQTPGHDGRLGYVRHPLLTELLRRLALARPVASEVHLRAAAWYRGQGDLPGELENLFAAGQHREAAERLYAARGGADVHRQGRSGVAVVRGRGAGAAAA